MPRDYPIRDSPEGRSPADVCAVVLRDDRLAVLCIAQCPALCNATPAPHRRLDFGYESPIIRARHRAPTPLAGCGFKAGPGLLQTCPPFLEHRIVRATLREQSDRIS